MNREDPYRDHAERLRKKMDKASESTNSVKEKEELPPRSRLHREKRKKNKWKIKYPVISLLALFFILLPVVIFSMSKYWDIDKPRNSNKAATTESSFETVGFDEKEEEKGTTIEENQKVPNENPEPSNKVEEKPVLEQSQSNEEEEIPSDQNMANDKSGEEVEQPGSSDKNTGQDVIYHTVKKSETVYRISINYYNSPSGVEMIRKANNLKNDHIQTGQVLIIPMNK